MDTTLLWISSHRGSHRWGTCYSGGQTDASRPHGGPLSALRHREEREREGRKRRQQPGVSVLFLRSCNSGEKMCSQTGANKPQTTYTEISEGKTGRGERLLPPPTTLAPAVYSPQLNLTAWMSRMFSALCPAGFSPALAGKPKASPVSGCAHLFPCPLETPPDRKMH